MSAAAGSDRAGWGVPVAVAQDRLGARADEVADLVALLLDHADAAAGSSAQRRCVAERIAVGCLGDNHLWQDLQLPSRRELTALFLRWFPLLAARNDNGMRWKKFLYKQLCEREELFVCKSPSCNVCVDRPVCFGPEA